MDPITILTMAGLVCAGKALQKKESMAPFPETTPPPPVNAPLPDPPQSRGGFNLTEGNGRLVSEFTGVYNSSNPTAGVRKGYRLDDNPTFNDLTEFGQPFGQPVYNFADRMSQNISNKMNNLAPSEKQFVGPGLGVGPNVPAFGGYQQLYQVLPDNVNAYKLTTLPGRTGPPALVNGEKPPVIGQVTQYRPDTVITDRRRPPVKGRAQGQGGATTGVTQRPEHIFTKRPTIRSETTVRNDTLSFGPPKRIVSDLTTQERPTRNKGDYNPTRINDNVTPGINSFVGGYTNAPTNIRLADKRGKNARQGNPGRMNVRGDPIAQGGALTQVKDNTSTCYTGSAAPTGANNQEYVQDTYYQLNTNKGMYNPLSSNKNLNIAKRQLAKNPLVNTLWN